MGLNRVREAREGSVARHEVDGPAAVLEAKDSKTVVLARRPVPLTHWHWSRHLPIRGAESVAARTPVHVAHWHWSQHWPIPEAASAEAPA